MQQSQRLMCSMIHWHTSLQKIFTDLRESDPQQLNKGVPGPGIERFDRCLFFKNPHVSGNALIAGRNRNYCMRLTNIAAKIAQIEQ
jgi:hypothetical protein